MKTISKNELVSKLGTDGEIVVNVLESPSYEKIHIKGSISIPLSQLKAGRWTELDKNKEIVTHCSSYTCDASREAAEFLETQGFKVKAYEGGMREWAESNLPTEGKYTPEQYLEEKYGKPNPTAKVV
jgi:rhodanese-related sulfurtransferase